jgi:hypothetical protein
MQTYKFKGEIAQTFASTSSMFMKMMLVGFFFSGINQI